MIAACTLLCIPEKSIKTTRTTYDHFKKRFVKCKMCHNIITGYDCFLKKMISKTADD